MKKSLEALELRRQRLEAARRCGRPAPAASTPSALGGVGDRLAVLVGAGEEEHVLAALAHVAREHVGGDRRVRVAEVRLRVDVVDRRGDVEGHAVAQATGARVAGERHARASSRGLAVSAR